MSYCPLLVQSTNNANSYIVTFVTKMCPRTIPEMYLQFMNLSSVLLSLTLRYETLQFRFQNLCRSETFQNVLPHDDGAPFLYFCQRLASPLVTFVINAWLSVGGYNRLTHINRPCSAGPPLSEGNSHPLAKHTGRPAVGRGEKDSRIGSGRVSPGRPCAEHALNHDYQIERKRKMASASNPSGALVRRRQWPGPS